MSKQTVRKTIKLDANLWSSFQEKIEQEYGTTYKHTSEEIENAIANYINKDIQDIEKTKILLPNYHFIVHEMFSQHSINGEIIKKGMDKGLAIKKVVETLHMIMEDTIAFGDSMNDYEMLQTVKYGYAMANAMPPVKEVAYQVIDSNENDGVILKIKEILKGNY